MRVYLVENIEGWWLGEFDIPVWWERLSTIRPVQHGPIRGLDQEMLQDYYEYLWRLGEYTFGRLYAASPQELGSGARLEYFADANLIELWPSGGKLWSPVGAGRWAWGWRAVMRLPILIAPEEQEERWAMPGEPNWPAKPSQVPSRKQPAIVTGWGFSFATLTWEQIPYLVVPSVPPTGAEGKKFEPVATSRVMDDYDIILRYREDLWWAKSVFMAHDNKWVFDQAYPIGAVLMFEKRGSGVAKKREDEWNFGMVWWERRMVKGKANWYLWATANVRYLGMGIRKSATILGLQETRT